MFDLRKLMGMLMYDKTKYLILSNKDQAGQASLASNNPAAARLVRRSHYLV